MAQFDKWCLELERALSEPFPAALIQQKSMGGARIDFVAVHHYEDRLDVLVGGGWSNSVEFKIVGDKLVALVTLNILGVSRTNVGDENGDKDDYGTASTNAFAQAFKRTCALFGLGRHLYMKGNRANGPVEAMATAVKAARARTIDDLAEDSRRDNREAKKPEAKRQPKRLPPVFDADGAPHCPVCNEAVWDNSVSGKLSPKSPDYKCRDKTCDWAYWLPEDKPKPQAPDPLEPPADLWGDQ